MIVCNPCPPKAKLPQSECRRARAVVGLRQGDRTSAIPPPSNGRSAIADGCIAIARLALEWRWRSVAGARMPTEPLLSSCCDDLLDFVQIINIEVNSPITLQFLIF